MLLIIVTKQTHTLYLANLQSKPFPNLIMEIMGKVKARPNKEDTIILDKISGGRNTSFGFVNFIVLTIYISCSLPNLYSTS